MQVNMANNCHNNEKTYLNMTIWTRSYKHWLDASNIIWTLVIYQSRRAFTLWRIKNKEWNSGSTGSQTWVPPHPFHWMISSIVITFKSSPETAVFPLYTTVKLFLYIVYLDSEDKKRKSYLTITKDRFWLILCLMPCSDKAGSLPLHQGLPQTCGSSGH